MADVGAVAMTVPHSSLRWSTIRNVVLLLIAGGLLGALPFLMPERYLTTAIQTLVWALFAAAFNLLWNHARLLSFGQAAYFGIGMFATIHLMRAVEAGTIILPLPLVPIAGLLAGGALGLVCGWFATTRSGTYFAMITLAIAELIHSLGPQWEAVFGGEAGISTMRMPWVGFTFATMDEIWYLVLGWFVIGIGALYFFARTPFGRVTYALGDNETRLRFLGYKTHRVKTVLFAVSAALSGLAGGLLAVTNENVDYGIFIGFVSATPVLHTFIGGAGLFFGPILGAGLLVWFGSLVGEMTRLWILYQGLIFVLVVIFVPQGIAGLIAAHGGLGAGEWRRLFFPYVAATVAVVLAALAVIFLAESASVLLSNAYAATVRPGAPMPVYRALGFSWSSQSVLTWVAPVLALAAAFALFAGVRDRIASVWGDDGRRPH